MFKRVLFAVFAAVFVCGAFATFEPASASASRNCLASSAKALLNRIEARFGRMQVISTCRPGARIRGTGKRSRHATGHAVDFNAGSRKGAVVRWLIANHKSGGIMTYAGMSHIHVDIGYRFVSLNHGGKRYRSRARTRTASRRSSSGRRSARSRSRAATRNSATATRARITQESSSRPRVRVSAWQNAADNGG